MSQMRAVAITAYGGVDKLKAVHLTKPSDPTGYDLLVKVKACSTNPVDTKVRAGTYDDYQRDGNSRDYYNHTPKLPQVIGFDGAGVVKAAGPEAQGIGFKLGDAVYYSGSPIRHGSNAQYQLVDARAAARKPEKLDFVEAAALPLTWITAYEALVERLEIKEDENAGVLIVNGAGGVGSVASQIARHILRLPVVITTTSREETTAFSKEMGATHTVNHHGDLPQQIRDLNLSTPIKYVFITHRTEQYIAPAAAVCAPFGKVCSIVQTQELPMYGTEWMTKGLTFVWELLGTKPWYGVEVDSHGRILKQLQELVDRGVAKTHLRQRLPLNEEGVRKAHELLESGKVIGKVGLGVDEGGLLEEETFA
ncbi:uncharacterized protein K452DRAFT_352866 [Aplosporella prunicola CBS 121167]|uniref:Enoyl reductase (ER) domain-containing protein n=1 Tax=Aplosporella prunicola CBS 121167 TaxID=1176127 RepID=A0A6A6B3T4_9PEZI|nr:uncharacterized protein K452DRAFT_352866 [Aplosporella prunicola CBS 121167]KAF2138720.1 hypothetical protein K452DRAFT_352866 [Aplosporella prunicola CBS 121167]